MAADNSARIEATTVLQHDRPVIQTNYHFNFLVPLGIGSAMLFFMDFCMPETDNR